MDVSPLCVVFIPGNRVTRNIPDLYSRKSKTAKTILNKMSKAGGITLSEFTVYYKVISNKNSVVSV